MTTIVRMPSGLYVVSVNVLVPIGRVQLQMTSDTNAARTVIQETLVQPLRLFAIAGTGLTGVSGSVAAGRTTLSRVEVDGRAIRNLVVGTMHLPRDMVIDVLLGLDFLGAGRLELDFAAGTDSLS